jgi:hypothetical protein
MDSLILFIWLILFVAFLVHRGWLALCRLHPDKKKRLMRHYRRLSEQYSSEEKQDRRWLVNRQEPRDVAIQPSESPTRPLDDVASKKEL